MSGWVAWSAYFVGVAAIVCSGIILKKTKMFAGDPAPFVMELPAYHWPTVGNVLRSMWERGWSFIKKAGTIITLSTIILWFLMNFGWADGSFGMLDFGDLEGAALEAAQAELCSCKDRFRNRMDLHTAWMDSRAATAGRWQLQQSAV